MGMSIVTRNYQVTIPKDVRETTGIKVGDKVVFSIEGDKVEVRKLSKETAEKAFGSWKGSIKGSSVDYVRKMRKEWNKREKRLGLR